LRGVGDVFRDNFSAFFIQSSGFTVYVKRRSDTN